MLTLSAFYKVVASPLGRRITLALVVAGALFLARLHYLNVGREQGKQQGRDAVVAESKDQVQVQQAAARERLNEVLDEASTKLDAAQQRYDRATALIDQQRQAIESLSKQRQQAHEQVAVLPDGDLHIHNIQRLAIRPIADVTPGYVPAEEREIAEALDQLPLCEQQNSELSQNVAALNEKVSATEQKLDAVMVRDHALTDYANFTARSYTDLYNLFPRRRNWFLTIVTLGVKGKAPALALPSPIELEKRRADAR